MQAIIMAAGKGSRLGNLTDNIPKSFIEIENKKLIEYNIDMLEKYGVTDIIIVTGHMYEQFENMFQDKPNITLVYNPFYETSNVLTSYWCGQHKLNQDFIYIHADTLCDTNIFQELLETQGDIVLPVDFGPCDEEAMKVIIDNNRVVKINKTMDPRSADGEFIGIAKISHRCLSRLNSTTINILKDKNFKAFFEVAIQKMIDNEEDLIKAIPTRGKFWCEIDFIDDYIDAKKNISETLLNL